jgi:hypothetical protein
MILPMWFVALLALCLTPGHPGAAQNADSAIRELKQRQKSERKALKLQQKATERAVKGREHTAAERKGLKRQMKAERNLLEKGHRDQMLSAREQQKLDKANRAASEP